MSIESNYDLLVTVPGVDAVVLKTVAGWRVSGGDDEHMAVLMARGIDALPSCADMMRIMIGEHTIRVARYGGEVVAIRYKTGHHVAKSIARAMSRMAAVDRIKRAPAVPPPAPKPLDPHPAEQAHATQTG